MISITYQSVFISFSGLVDCVRTHTRRVCVLSVNTQTLIGGRGTLQSGVSGLSTSMRLRTVSLIRGSLVQDISIGHQQGPRWLCSPASSWAAPVTLLFYRTEGHCPKMVSSGPITENSLYIMCRCIDACQYTTVPRWCESMWLWVETHDVQTKTQIVWLILTGELKALINLWWVTLKGNAPLCLSGEVVTGV